MSAVNPLPASGAPADKRPYEPSMEEILASIRRIIADDQTLPGKAIIEEPEVKPEGPVGLDRPAPESAPAPNPFSTLRHEPATPPQTPEPHIEPVARLPEPQVATPVAPPEPPRPTIVGDLKAHGVIAAPQFAAPHGPASDPEPEAPAPVQEEMRAPPLPEPEAAVPVPPPPPAPAFEDDDDALYDQAIEPSPLPLHIEDEVPSTRPAAEAAGLFSSATDSSITSAFNMLAASRLADNSDELLNLAREMIRPLLRSWIDDNLPSMVERLVRAEIERVARGGR